MDFLPRGNGAVLNSVAFRLGGTCGPLHRPSLYSPLHHPTLLSISPLPLHQISDSDRRDPGNARVTLLGFGVVHPTQLANRHLVKLGLIKSERKKTLSIIDHAATLQEIRRPKKEACAS
ncbi:hypothetical protein EVAR_53426_1 [Eumeta japonica]|uniref:Uncharacterized protein n=1 Tax=Eumeta variegata TaxID=151549 RepID=A0A4C1Y473_EUMVA|nr:hypothetical protein EVAR_53426_1 [Eumeta japonica]